MSEGWIFGNSFNTELATGTAEIGDKNFFEAGARVSRKRGLSNPAPASTSTVSASLRSVPP